MEDKDIYTIALMRYKEENPNIDEDNMFTADWVLSKNYKLKTIIIAEAITNHTTVEQTETYKNEFIKKIK
jgi:hypothetical protein